MKTATKKERRQAQLLRHYSALAALAATCGIPNADGKKLSVKLLKIERQAHKEATDYCNGDIDTDEFGSLSSMHEEEVGAMFNRKLKGMFVNGDARGYALKINDEVMRQEYKEIGLQQDWGGYGLLSPEIDGN